jgi:hypothetical protein
MIYNIYYKYKQQMMYHSKFQTEESKTNMLKAHILE